jgi:hypothetical protein
MMNIHRNVFTEMLDHMGVPYDLRDDARLRATAEKDRETFRARWGEDLDVEGYTMSWLARLHNAPEAVALRTRSAVALHDGDLLFMFGEDGGYLGYGEADNPRFYPAPGTVHAR